MRIVAFLASLVLSCPAWADKLPGSATPLNATEVTAIYSGKSQINKTSDVYFAADGSLKGVFGKPKVKDVFAGKWHVTDNQMCMDSVAKSDGKTYTDCTKFWRSGKSIYSLWATHYDGSKADEVDGYWTKEITRIKSGDLVTKRYLAAGGV